MPVAPGQYWWTTVGVSAILLGIGSLRETGHGRRIFRVIPVVGIVLGLAATSVMTVHVVTALSQRSSSPGQAASPAFAAPFAPTATAAPVTMTSDRAAVAQTAGTIAFLLKKDREEFNLGYPTVLAPTDGMIVTPEGTVRLPVGARMIYQPFQNQSGYLLIITGSSGAVAEFSTASGTVSLH